MALNSKMRRMLAKEGEAGLRHIVEDSSRIGRSLLKGGGAAALLGAGAAVPYLATGPHSGSATDTFRTSLATGAGLGVGAMGAGAILSKTARGGVFGALRGAGKGVIKTGGQVTEKAAKGAVKATPGALRGSYKLAKGVGKFAAAHPLLTLAGAGIAYMGLGGPSSQDASPSDYYKAGMNSPSTGKMSPVFKDSASGLSLGLHRSRHG